MNAASESGGFAVDEFNDDGMWNRRLLTKWATLVMKDTSSQDVLGAAIIGKKSYLTQQIMTMDLKIQFTEMQNDNINI